MDFLWLDLHFIFTDGRQPNEAGIRQVVRRICRKWKKKQNPTVLFIPACSWIKTSLVEEIKKRFHEQRVIPRDDHGLQVPPFLEAPMIVVDDAPLITTRHSHFVGYLPRFPHSRFYRVERTADRAVVYTEINKVPSNAITTEV